MDTIISKNHFVRNTGRKYTSAGQWIEFTCPAFMPELDDPSELLDDNSRAWHWFVCEFNDRTRNIRGLVKILGADLADEHRAYTAIMDAYDKNRWTGIGYTVGQEYHQDGREVEV